MADSEQQFQELLAHLVVRVNNMLSAQGPVMPLGLLLRAGGKVDVSFGVADNARDVAGMTKAIREALVGVVAGGGVHASCIAFPHENGEAVIALLENHENYCATVSIPLLVRPVRKLDTDNMQIDDGYVHVFPVAPD